MTAGAAGAAGGSKQAITTLEQWKLPGSWLDRIHTYVYVLYVSFAQPNVTRLCCDVSVFQILYLRFARFAFQFHTRFIRVFQTRYVGASILYMYSCVCSIPSTIVDNRIIGSASWAVGAFALDNTAAAVGLYTCAFSRLSSCAVTDYWFGNNEDWALDGSWVQRSAGYVRWCLTLILTMLTTYDRPASSVRYFIGPWNFHISKRFDRSRDQTFEVSYRGRYAYHITALTLQSFIIRMRVITIRTDGGKYLPRIYLVEYCCTIMNIVKTGHGFGQHPSSCKRVTCLIATNRSLPCAVTVCCSRRGTAVCWTLSPSLFWVTGHGFDGSRLLVLWACLPRTSRRRSS